ncbi:hypothetical protein FRC12_018283, partial [Ceratobasidium sp. 428]
MAYPMEAEYFSLPRFCNACGNFGHFQCLGCAYIWYCSSDCWHRDRLAHQVLCPLFAGAPPAGSFQLNHRRNTSFDPAPAPLPHAHAPTPINIQQVRALILPQDRTRYFNATVELHGSLGQSGYSRWTPQLAHIFGTEKLPTSIAIIKGTSDNPLRYPLHVFLGIPVEKMPEVADVGLNTCVQELTGGTSHPWKGAIVVLKFNGSRRRGYQNIEYTDLALVKHFLRINDTSVSTPFVAYIRCVLNCSRPPTSYHAISVCGTLGHEYSEQAGELVDLSEAHSGWHGHKGK